MKKELKQFLNFNGQNINVLTKDGTTWVAIKPICTALGVDYIRQFKNVQEDIILSGVLSKQTIHDSINRLQEMVCLPEKYVYGWLFSINSQSEQLIKYKKECYDILFDHFHGAMTARLNSLRVRTEAEMEIEMWNEKLKETNEYQKLKLAEAKRAEENRLLKKQDEKLIENQISIFPNN